MVKKDKAAKAAKAQPKQKRLPTMEDAKIDELHAVAEQLFDHRKKRLEHGKHEHDYNEQLLKLMRKHGKTKYNFNGVHLTIVPKQEFVRVKIDKPEE